MPSIEACGARLYYSEEGAGPPVILLHASASNSGQWKALVKQLRGRWKVIVPDLPGYGGSQEPVMVGGRGLEAHALAVLDLIEHFGGRAHVIGHSMGGAVAMRLAVGAPESLLSLTVIEPTTFHLLRSGNRADRELFGEVQSLSRSIAAAAVDGEVNVGMRRFIDYWNGQGAWSMMRSTQRIKASHSIGQVMQDFAAGLAENWPAEYCRDFTFPVLAMMGMQSPAPALRTTEIVAEAAPNSQLRMITDAGHMLPMTHSAKVGASIAEFLVNADRVPTCVTVDSKQAA